MTEVASDHPESASPGLERDFLKVLAEVADNDQPLSCLEIKNEIQRRLGLDVEKMNALFAALETWGFVDKVRHTVSERFASFEVTKTATLVAQRLHTGAHTLRDRIDAFRARLRSWSWIALIALGLFAVLLLLALINQAFELLRNLGILPAR